MINMAYTYTIEEIRKIAVPVAKQYGVEKVALFGSYAKGEQKESSDIDLIIKKGNLKGYFAFCGFVNALVSHDQFGKIPQSPELQQRILQAELDKNTPDFLKFR